MQRWREKPKPKETLTDIEIYLINKAWNIRRSGDFVDWEDVRDDL